MKTKQQALEALQLCLAHRGAGYTIWCHVEIIAKDAIAALEADMGDHLYTAKQMSQYGQDCFEEGLASCPPVASAIAQEPTAATLRTDALREYLDDKRPNAKNKPQVGLD